MENEEATIGSFVINCDQSFMLVIIYKESHNVWLNTNFSQSCLWYPVSSPNYIFDDMHNDIYKTIFETIFWKDFFNIHFHLFIFSLLNNLKLYVQPNL